MIKIDEEDPVGEVEPSFPYRDVPIQRGVDVKELYDLQSEIGRGKFGTVYKCREKATGLELAAKFLSTARKEDKRNVEREIDIMRTLQHPRLIQLYDALEKDKQMAVILELIVGGELFERVIDDDFILTEKSCTVFMRQICEAMEFIHKKNILHLDMKPENILCLTRTGNRIKIIDFGLARRFDPDKKLQVLFGTPEFVAPEVVNFDKIGYETDMWSIGVICYVLLSGLSPFMGETDIETMANVTISKWDFDDEAFFDISDDAKDFISKLLVKDKEKRMTATQCLAHPWLRRRPPKKQPPPPPAATTSSALDVAKDNLRGFVERWSEHPTSPYLFDTSFHTISPCVSATNILAPPSMCPDSPSPCGSLSSMASPAPTPPSSPKPLPRLPDRWCVFDRRASDSTCFVRHNNDFVKRINLAEEIKKLSDKLLEFNHASDAINNNEDTSNNFFRSSVTTKSTIFDQAEDVWANRRKLKFSNHNRDVPLAQSCWSRDSSSTVSSGSSEQSAPQSPEPPDMTKELMSLMNELEGMGPRSLGDHRKSLSVEWTDGQSLGQRTMRSLSNYIQSSRGSVVQKKKSQFVKP